MWAVEGRENHKQNIHGAAKKQLNKNKSLTKIHLSALCRPGGRCAKTWSSAFRPILMCKGTAPDKEYKQLGLGDQGIPDKPR